MMKHYLDLVGISAKVHRKQSRMTRVCIVLAVFLVSCIFSMADMEIQSQRYQTIQQNGAWHAAFRGLSTEQETMIRNRPEVKNASRYAVTNYRLDQGYTVEQRQTVFAGFDKEFIDMMPAAKIGEGRYPSGDMEAAVSEGMKKEMGLETGDLFTVHMPDGKEVSLKVSGFTGDTSLLASKDVFGVFLNMDTYMELFREGTQKADCELYVQFSPYCRIQKTIDDISSQLDIPSESVGQNTKILALQLQSDDPFMMQLYAAAAILAVLVCVAGILMISSSMNSNVAQRTRFFGMLRCLGADRRQVTRFVRREALNWCFTAVPAGLVLSVATVWGLCVFLREISPTYFLGLPVFGVSWIGLAGGTAVGFVTVLLAVHSPAKRASRVSPLTAMSGNAQTEAKVRHSANTRLFRIETGLGVHHAVGSRKNLLLMTGSFAFSIILFLSFSPAVDFMNHAVQPLKPSAPDISISSPDGSGTIPAELEKQMEENPVVKRVYGRKILYDIPVDVNGKSQTAALISYDEDQFEWAEENLIAGSLEDAINGKGVAAVYPAGTNPGSKDEEVTFRLPSGDRTVPVSGTLSETVFHVKEQERYFVCSEELFQKFTGMDGFETLNIQLTPDAADRDVDAIREQAGDQVIFSDKRMENAETKGAYYAFSVFIYGFLAVIALISIFNIINSIDMSVTARMKQYGAMRAIGMDCSQLIRMVAVEAVSYVVSGMVIGCAAGLYLNYILYDKMVTYRWGDPWQLPSGALAVILGVMALSVVLAVKKPAGRIRKMDVVDTIGAL